MWCTWPLNIALYEDSSILSSCAIVEHMCDAGDEEGDGGDTIGDILRRDALEVGQHVYLCGCVYVHDVAVRQCVSVQAVMGASKFVQVCRCLSAPLGV